jgi:hypothetical protein
MPTTRRKIRRRHSASDELRAWNGVFETGKDYFHELPTIGLRHWIRVWPADRREVAKAEFMEATRSAWERLGARHMAERGTGYGYNVEQPWALTEFGEP